MQPTLAAGASCSGATAQRLPTSARAGAHRAVYRAAPVLLDDNLALSEAGRESVVRQRPRCAAKRLRGRCSRRCVRAAHRVLEDEEALNHHRGCAARGARPTPRPSLLARSAPAGRSRCALRRLPRAGAARPHTHRRAQAQKAARWNATEARGKQWSLARCTTFVRHSLAPLPREWQTLRASARRWAPCWRCRRSRRRACSPQALRSRVSPKLRTSCSTRPPSSRCWSPTPSCPTGKQARRSACDTRRERRSDCILAMQTTARRSRTAIWRR